MGSQARIHVVVVSGMSGAGRSTALDVLEDLGYFCVDNLPPFLATQLVAALERDPELKRLALGIDARAGHFIDDIAQQLDALRAQAASLEVLFFDASDEALIRRFSETRRPHPLGAEGNISTLIAAERERLAPLRLHADEVVDTSRLTVHELRRRLSERTARGAAARHMVVRFVSFGYKYGVPVEADLVFDVRCLPNPFFVPELRDRSGRDPEVASFVVNNSEAKTFVTDLTRWVERALPLYDREGKAQLTIACGCTGGRHRSVAIVETLAEAIRRLRDVRVSHRDVERGLRNELAPGDSVRPKVD